MAGHAGIQGRNVGAGKARGAMVFLCAALAVEGPLGCRHAPQYSQKHIDCYDNVCGPLRMEAGEVLRVRLPNGSEVVVEPREGERCVKVTVPEGFAAEVGRDRALRPEMVKAADERRWKNGDAP